MKLAIIKSEYARGTQKAGDVADILPDNHIFSDIELQLFDIIQIEDSEVKTVNKEIEDYYKTAVITGSTPTTVKKYYDGELKWQTA